jgi:isopentenyl phosphate kinase
MAGKVAQMLTLVEEIPDLVVQIFTGMEPVRLQEALEGVSVGTSIKSSQRQIPR